MFRWAPRASRRGIAPLTRSFARAPNQVSHSPRSILRNRALPAVFAASLVCVSSATADWLVLKTARGANPCSSDSAERFIVVSNVNGKNWSLILEAVDVETTRALNGMSENERLSPGWPRPDVPADVVTTARTAPETVDRRPGPPGSQTPEPNRGRQSCLLLPRVL